MRRKDLTFLLLVLSLAISSACRSAPANSNANTAGTTNSTNNAPANTTQPATTTSNVYPQETRDAFLKSCEGAGSTPVFCVCVFDKIQQTYSYDEFKAMEDAMLEGEAPAEFLKFGEKVRADCTK